MKKVLTIIALIAASAFSAKAQLRIEAGAGIGNYKVSINSDHTANVTPELKVMYEFGAFGEGGFDAGFEFHMHKITNKDINSKMSISNLDIPFHAYYNLNFGNLMITPYVGFYAGYAVGGKTTVAKVETSPFDGPQGMKKFDFGFDSEIVITLKKHLTFGIGLQNGFINLSKDKDFNCKSNAAYAAVGWRF